MSHITNFRKAASLQRFIMGKKENATSQISKGQNSEMKKNESPTIQDQREEFENNLKSPELTGNDEARNLDTGRSSTRKIRRKKIPEVLPEAQQLVFNENDDSDQGF